MLPPELSAAGRGAPALRRADRGGDAEAAVAAVARGVLDRDQPARERRRQEPPAHARQAVLAASSRPSRCSSSRTSSSPSSDAIDAFEKVANIVEQIAVKEVLSRSMELAIVIAVVVVALVFDYTNGFHDAANAIATSVSTRALTPRIALIAGRGHELRRRPPRPGGRAHRQRRDRRRGAGDAGLVDRAGRPARRDHVEPDHLVLRAALVVVARADRRPGRRRDRRPARSCTGTRSSTRCVIPMVAVAAVRLLRRVRA